MAEINRPVKSACFISTADNDRKGSLSGVLEKHTKKNCEFFEYMEHTHLIHAGISTPPFFSVIIPVYNKAQHINRALSSVMGQSFTDFEIIIIDDASTDKSVYEINKFADCRMRVFKRDNPGPGGYAARNLGIQKARSEWIAFLDADDEWYPCHLQNAFEEIRKHPEVGIVTSGWLESFSGGVQSYDPYTRKYKSRGTHTWDIEQYLMGARPIWTGVAVIRKNLLVRAGGFDENFKHGGDTELWLRLLLQKTISLWIAEVQAVYHRDSVNMVTSNLTQTFSPTALTIRKFLHDNSDIQDEFRLKLKKFSNRIAKKNFVRKINKGDLARHDVFTTFYWDCLNLKARLLLMLLYIAPCFFKNFFIKKMYLI